MIASAVTARGLCQRLPMLLLVVLLARRRLRAEAPCLLTCHVVPGALADTLRIAGEREQRAVVLVERGRGEVEQRAIARLSRRTAEDSRVADLTGVVDEA